MYTQTHKHIKKLKLLVNHFSFFGGGCPSQIMWHFPGQGLNLNYSCQLTPQPQQCQILATSATYTTAQATSYL